MHLQSIVQEPLPDSAEVLTKVVINQVDSQCILTRLMLQAFGRPGVANDMEIFGSGAEWIFVWTRPHLTIDATRALVLQAIAPKSYSNPEIDVLAPSPAKSP